MSMLEAEGRLLTDNTCRHTDISMSASNANNWVLHVGGIATASGFAD